MSDILRDPYLTLGSEEKICITLLSDMLLYDDIYNDEGNWQKLVHKSVADT